MNTQQIASVQTAGK